MNWIKFLKVKTFRGVISRDQIAFINNSGYYIVNLNDSTQPGSHWVVIHIRSPVRRKNDIIGELEGLASRIEYFDSFGLNAPMELVELSDRMGLNYLYNSTQYQDLKSVLCGYWCLYFVNESRKGRSYYDILKPFSHTDTQFNERLIVEYFRS